MESNLSFLASRAISTPTAEASPAAAPAHAPAGQGDFAEVLNGQTLKAQRQHQHRHDEQHQRRQTQAGVIKPGQVLSDS